MIQSYKYCPFCRQKLVLEKIEKTKKKVCSNCGFIDYQNARPTASTVIFNDKNEILLAKRNIEPFKGQWNIVGGFLDSTERAEKGAIREVKEETGLDVKLIDYLGINPDSYYEPAQGLYYTFNVAYSAKIIGGKLRVDDENKDLKFFPLDKLPPICFKCDRQAVATYKKRLGAK